MWMDTRFGSPTADVRAWTISSPSRSSRQPGSWNASARASSGNPWEWGFERMDGVSDGKLSLSDELRAFVDINQENRTLLVYRVYRRENLYG